MPSLGDVLRAVPYLLPILLPSFVLNIYFFTAFHDATLEAARYKVP
jgi:hypothetical protein